MLNATASEIEFPSQVSRACTLMRELAKFKHRLFCSGRSAMRLSPRRMGRPSVRFSSAKHHVSGVIGLRSNVEVPVIDTWRIITMMKNIFAMWDLAVRKRISVPMSLDGLLRVKFENPISVFVCAACINPAWAEFRTVLRDCTVLIYFCPKTRFGWFRMGWHVGSSCESMMSWAARGARTSLRPIHYTTGGA